MKNTPLISIFKKLSEPQKLALKKLHILTIKDLLYHFPTRYGDTQKAVAVATLTPGISATIFGKISKLKITKTFTSHVAIATATITDATGSIKAIWFNQPYIAKMFTEGGLVKISGPVTERKEELSFLNPQIESVSEIPNIAGTSLFGSDGEELSLYPVYQESKGITSNWIYHAITKIFNADDFKNIIDPIPEEILQKYNLPSIKTAFIWIHSPKKETDALAARKRFAFEEVFFIQLRNQMERAKQKKEKSFVIKKTKEDIEEFTKRFPFEITASQNRAISEILKDFSHSYPMSRLLEGDVGSGKTAVAATVAYGAVTTNPKGDSFGSLQVAYMAPTEILAKQHFESFIKYFSHMPISIGLITGSGCRKFPSKINPDGWTTISRPQFLKWVESGEISIVIGTHALIQKTVKFKNLALVIIDEQHRFGTEARQKLMRKESRIPHLLSMTATPIPRTLALTIYGDLDLSLIEEMPTGRKKTITKIVLPSGRENVYEKIRKLINEGKQAYVICPKIDPPANFQETLSTSISEQTKWKLRPSRAGASDPNITNKINAKSVKDEAVRLKKHIFPEFSISVMHGKMTPSEKDKVMLDFEEGKINILVATSVIEVGVNIPNATSIIIEGAERFGLSQLHQLRGRVARSTDQSYCYVFTESTNEKTTERLKALESAKNGFELSELDLKLRGAGELYIGKQWGLSDLAMEAIKNIKMVEAARAEAKEIVQSDNDLRKNQHLLEILSKQEEVHFE